MREGLKLRKGGLKGVETRRGQVNNEEEEVELGEPLSPSARLCHEPNFNLYIIAIMGCKTKIDPEVIKANLDHTLIKHPRFSSLQIADEKDNKIIRWARTKVDLDKHVIVPNMDNVDQQNISPDKLLEDYVSNLTRTTIDPSQPLWDLHLINLKTSESEATGVFRIHHSLGDGTSLMSVTLACTRQIEHPEALPTLPVKRNKNSGFGVGWWFWQCLVTFRMFWNTMVDVFMFLLTALFLKDTETPLKGSEGVESRPRRFVWRNVSLDDIKLIKNAMNLTINDVALGVTQGGLSKYLSRKYGGQKEALTEKKNNLPKNIRMRSTMLVNLRQSAGIEAFANMMEKDAEVVGGNWIGYILLPFTIGIRDDPLDYVREAKAIVDRKKQSLESIFTFSIAEMIFKLFGVKTASALSHKVISRTTLCFSNLAGPEQEIGFYGHPMAYLAPSSFNQPHALMINFQSYANKMTIVLSVDEGTIPDPHQLVDDIVDSLKLIKDAAASMRLAMSNTGS